ncbi:hypothetical protein GCM10027343_28620 [Noviherbaspirillum agri]
MKIRREDLVAAAALGLLQRRQIGPLFLFLLQRDVRAKRMALVAQARVSQQHGFYRLLFYLAAFLAVATTLLFSVLLVSAAPMEGGVLLVFGALYLMSAWALITWVRNREFGRRIRTVPALMLASVPLAMVAVQQVAA